MSRTGQSCRHSSNHSTETHHILGVAKKQVLPGQILSRLRHSNRKWASWSRVLVGILCFLDVAFVQRVRAHLLTEFTQRGKLLSIQAISALGKNLEEHIFWLSCLTASLSLCRSFISLLQLLTLHPSPPPPFPSTERYTCLLKVSYILILTKVQMTESTLLHCPL